MQSGLLELKLLQLSRVTDLDEIIVSTNDDDISRCALRMSSEVDSRITVDHRPAELATSVTPMSRFIRYCSTLRDEGVILMTHVTHPFVSSSVFNTLIQSWDNARQNGHDSLVTVTRIHKFLWDASGPYNYDSAIEKWPRSQDLKPLFEINHAAYILPIAVMRECDDRIGRNPFLHELPESIVMDVDWDDQFTLVEDVALGRITRGVNLL